MAPVEQNNHQFILERKKLEAVKCDCTVELNVEETVNELHLLLLDRDFNKPLFKHYAACEPPVRFQHHGERHGHITYNTDA